MGTSVQKIPGKQEISLYSEDLDASTLIKATTPHVPYLITRINETQFVVQTTKAVNLFTAYRKDGEAELKFKDLNICFLNNAWKAFAYHYNQETGTLDWWNSHQVNMERPIEKSLSLLHYSSKI